MFNIYADTAIAHTQNQQTTGNAFETVITAQDFAAAQVEITSWDGYAPTPLYHLRHLAAAIGVGEIHYKDEAARFGLGSFKALGGAYAGLRVLQRKVGGDATLAGVRAGHHAQAVARVTLASATDGNHGRSLAWGAQRFGAPCQIYIHRDVSETRAKAMRDLGAVVTRIDGDYDASVDQLRRDADARGWHVVSDTSWQGYTQPPIDVMAGYGVMASEIIQSLMRAPTHVFLQGGVGGLAAAVAALFAQRWQDDAPRVVVVEPELAACLFASAKAGAATGVTINKETLMAGLSCGAPSPLAWEILREQASGFITIPERLVAPTMQVLGRPLGDDPAIIAGESAIAGLAAAMAAALGPLRETLGLTSTSRVLLIGSEGATDIGIYQKLMGLSAPDG